MSIRRQTGLFWHFGAAVVLLGWSAAVARAQLIEHLPLDGNADAAVGTSGTLAGTPTPTPAPDRNGNPSGALSFASSGVSEGGRVEVAGGGGLNNLQTGTIAFFVKWTGPQDPPCCGGTFGNVTSRQGNGLFSNQIIGLNNADPAQGRIAVQLYNAQAPILVGNTAVGDGTWRHVALTYTSGQQQIYLDGNLDGSSAVAGTITDNAGVPLSIGAWIGDGAGYSTSMMDDFRVYNTVLTQPEIQALIPEPAGLSLLALGAVAIGAAGRRRR